MRSAPSTGHRSHNVDGGIQMKWMATRVLSSLVAGVVLTMGVVQTAHAQSTEEIRFGMYAGIVYSLVGAGSMQLFANNDAVFQDSTRNFSDPTDLSDGQGLGPHFGMILEYKSGHTLGASLKLGADVYVAEMEDAPNNANFTTSVNYFTIEPGLRLEFADKLALTVGPTLGVLITAKYDYDPGSDNTAAAEGLEGARIEGMNETVFGVFGDFTYDIQIRGDNEDGDSPIYLSPFIGVNWITDQRGADDVNNPTGDELDDVWSTVGIRLGLQLKFGELL